MFFSLFISLSLCDSTDLKLDHTQQHHFLLVSGSHVILEVVKPYTLVVFSELGEARGHVCINTDGECHEAGTIGMFNESYNLSGVWFGKNTGEIRLETTAMVTVKFSSVLFPSDCDKYLTTNTRNYTINLAKEDFIYNIKFCFYPATYGTYQYKVSYIIGDNDLLHISRKDNVPRNYGGNNRFTGTSVADDPVLFSLDTSDPHINSTVNFSIICDDIIPETNITTYLNSSNLTFLPGQYLDDFPPPEVDDKFSNILSITLIVIFVGCGIGCIVYRIVSYCKKKKLRELRAIERANAPKKRYKKIIRNKPRPFVPPQEKANYQLDNQEDHGFADVQNDNN